MTGPCALCGGINYPASLGGPGICPSCDCGIPPEVSRLRRENQRLRLLLAEARGEAIGLEDLLLPKEEPCA